MELAYKFARDFHGMIWWGYTTRPPQFMQSMHPQSTFER
jgi:hypothetical protein